MWRTGFRSVRTTLPDRSPWKSRSASGAVFEDNYFDLLPGESRTVRLLHATDGQKVRVSAVLAEAVEVGL